MTVLSSSIGILMSANIEKIYGMAALREPPSQGAINLVDQLEESNEPLWVISWGGTNVLAEALQHIRRERTPEEQKKLHSRLRVYTISDQDDTGDWIRVTFPDIFYICSIHGFGAFDMSAWQGIAHPIAGGDMSKVSAEWLTKHIQKGPLGKVYPTPMHIMEGDTPTFLYLIQNGLGNPENPSFGSWGGRYRAVTVGSPRYADVIDTIVEADGSERTDNKVTIRRWRDHFQNDFATRMRWTLTSDFDSVSHPAVPIVNGHTGPSHLRMNVNAGDAVVLDAGGSFDPDHPNDNSHLTFRWYQYAEPTLNHPIGAQAVPRCSIRELESTHADTRVQTFDTAGFEILAQGPRVEVTVPKSNEPAIFNLPAQHWLPHTGIDGLAYHIILEVVNTDIEFPVRRYLRIILDAGLT